MIVPDWTRRVAYLLLGRLFNRPPLLVGLARTLARAGQPMACELNDLLALYRRTDDFSNRAHADNLVAGDFVIGMDSGPHQAQERAAVRDCLPDALAFGTLAAAEAHARAERIRTVVDRGESFDLVNDYLVFVAWSGLRGAFDAAAAASIEGVGAGTGPAARDAALAVLFQELRHVGGYLVVGGVAPLGVRARAQTAADALNQRVSRNLADIRAGWATRCPYAARTAQRQAVGLMWVGHPAMVQAGALIFQELQTHREAHEKLCESVRTRLAALGERGYADEALRQEVRGHVLECLRLRPPFPLLSRLLPRAADVRLGVRKRVSTVRAGGSVYLVIAAALRGATPDYDPTRALDQWRADPDRLPIFGAGPRACVAGEQVVELLVSALIGLLSLPVLAYADAGGKRIGYDGPIVTRMRLRAVATTTAT